MAYPALQLITRSFYLSQIVARELQTITGTQEEEGLFLLNELLDFKSTDLRLIPYFKQYNFDTTAGSFDPTVGTWKVNIPGLLYIDSMTFNIGQVRYPMMDLSRKQFFAGPRVDNISTLPFSYRPERVLGGMDVYLYFTPADTYQFRIWGKFALTEVTLTTDMTTIYDMYYLAYLRHELCNYICEEYTVSMPDLAMERLKEYRKKVMDVSPPDLTIQKTSYFGSPWGVDWQTVNLYKGFLPGT